MAEIVNNSPAGLRVRCLCQLSDEKRCDHVRIKLRRIRSEWLTFPGSHQPAIVCGKGTARAFVLGRVLSITRDSCHCLLESLFYRTLPPHCITSERTGSIAAPVIGAHLIGTASDNQAIQPGSVRPTGSSPIRGRDPGRDQGRDQGIYKGIDQGTEPNCSAERGDCSPREYLHEVGTVLGGRMQVTVEAGVGNLNRVQRVGCE